MDSFLDNIPKFLSLQPDQRPDSKAIVETIRHKSQVCYFPLKLPDRKQVTKDHESPVHIVWPHRLVLIGEHDMTCKYWALIGQYLQVGT